MSTSEALQEYATAHEGDVEDVRNQLTDKVDEHEIRRVLRLLENDATSLVNGTDNQGRGFTVTRDFENHWHVIFEEDRKKAA